MIKPQNAELFFKFPTGAIHINNYFMVLHLRLRKTITK